MRKIIVDTNVFLRFLLNDIPAQRELAEKIFNDARQKKIILHVPQIIIFEIEFVLTKYYQQPKDEVVEKIDSLVQAAYFQVQNKEIFKKALVVFKEKTISFPDAFLSAYADKEDAELFTFDKKLEKLQ